MQDVLATDPSALINLIDLKAVGLIETTLITAGQGPTDLAGLQRGPYAEYLTGDADRVQGVIDIYEARRNRIIPLPARVRGTDDTVQVFEYRPAVSGPAGYAPDRSAARRTAGGRVEAPPRVQNWKNALLDLSLRNRLINFSDRSGLALSVPDGQLGALEDIVNEPKQVTLLARDQIDAVHTARGLVSGWELPADDRAALLTGRAQLFCDIPAGGYATRMRNLAYKARTIVEESGANNLYLALGSLVWKLDGRPLRSPLILVPVQLKPAGRGGLYRIGLDESGTSAPNFCLLEKLRQVHGLEIPDLSEPEDDAAGIDLNAALQSVRLAVNQAGLPYRVEETAHVAVLQFAKFRLWKDLDEQWQAFSANPLVRHLIETPTETFQDPRALSSDPRALSPDPHAPSPDLRALSLSKGIDPDAVSPDPRALSLSKGIDLDELAAACPVPADASQLAAVAAAVAGRTFVLEGPPGTGKSQTITNLLTRAMAEGQRVLFVAEKRAALDVVRKRLDDVGMGLFSLDLHDKGSKPVVVRNQIRQALDARIDIDAQGFAAEQERLRATRQSLDRYARSIHSTNPAGLSFYSAHTGRLALGHLSQELPVPPHLVGAPEAADRTATIRTVLRDLPDTADLANPRPEHPWGFVGAMDPQRADPDAIRQAARAVDAAVAAIPGDHPLADVLDQVGNAQELAMVNQILTSPQGQLWVLDEVRGPFWRPAVDDVRSRTVDFAATQHPGMHLATPAVLNLPLAQILEQAQAAAASGFFGRRKRLKAVLEQLRPGLRPEASVKPKDVPVLVAELHQTQQLAWDLGRQAAKIPGIMITQDWNPLTPAATEQLDAQVGWLQWASACVAPDSDRPVGPSLRSFLGPGRQLGQHELGSLGALVAAFTRLEAVTAASPEDAASWSAGCGLVTTWRNSTGQRDLDDPQLLDLRRWIAFVAALEPIRQAGLAATRTALLTGRVRADDAVQAFDLGVATASLAERSGATGLAAFDPQVHDKTISRFTMSAASLRAQQAALLPHQVLANRPFNSSNESGRIGSLRRELSKQRRGLTVRSLVAQYGDLITQVMPCVLVSPDSLSRFFPAQQGLFDLVVFDEASQIRVADAIGAIGRSKSVVVVGDSKQMPPTSFGEPSLDIGDEELAELADTLSVVEDEESILSECVQARVPQQWLSWHYRSQDESLIAFSNALYYEDRLSSFPAPHRRAAADGVDDVGVSLVRVQGEFQRTRGKLHRTNPVEAETIVAEVRRRFDGSPQTLPSIGIVTFNIQQRTLIESLLRDCGDDRILEALDDADDGLFVKNLENVQGDERDVIFFSTAFSVDHNGRLPLNFGPLNREGGERRLNVAVTRARRRVIVFSSFDPQQLRTEETSSRGIKDLRAYLDMAASGPQVLESLVTRQRRPSLPDRHREQVAEVLRQRGLVVSTNVGLSDFKIDLEVASAAEPDAPRLAVLLDGPDWARRGTVGDRDGLPIEVLSRMLRWPAVERVWLPAWLRDPEPTIQRLIRAVEQPDARPEPGAPRPEPGFSGREPVEGRTAAPGSSRPEPGFSRPEPVEGRTPELGAPRPEPVEGRAEPGFSRPEPGAPRPEPRSPRPEPVEGPITEALRRTATRNEDNRFAAWPSTIVGPRGVLNGLPAARATAQVRQVVEQVVQQEGPVHADRLARLVARSFDLNRLSEGRAQSILQTVPRELWDRAGEPFAWPRDVDQASWSGYRRQQSGSERPIEHISLREIGNAMVFLCREAAGMTQDDLLRETNVVFGGSRLTSAIRERLQVGLQMALDRGDLARTAGGVFVAAS
nr:DUF3320 domain-containing protein [Microlunatus panaciterrae]